MTFPTECARAINIAHKAVKLSPSPGNLFLSWRVEIVFCFFWRERRRFMVALGRFGIVSVAKDVEKFRVVIFTGNEH